MTTSTLAKPRARPHFGQDDRHLASPLDLLGDLAPDDLGSALQATRLLEGP
jgi:hypothetical protein